VCVTERERERGRYTHRGQGERGYGEHLSSIKFVGVLIICTTANIFRHFLFVCVCVRAHT